MIAHVIAAGRKLEQACQRFDERDWLEELVNGHWRVPVKWLVEKIFHDGIIDFETLVRNVQSLLLKVF
jgi:hypothetical protein